MKVSQFLSLLRNNTLQNLSMDMYGEADLINYVNGALNYLYNRILSRTDWYWAFYIEKITDAKRTTLDNDQGYKWEAGYPLTKIQYISDADDSQLRPANISFLIPGIGGTEVGGFARWPGSDKFLAAKEETDYLTIYYFRGPKHHEYANATSEELDLPDGLITALQLVCYWLMYPIQFEQGASLSNKFKADADEYIDTYILNHTYENTSFTSPE